MLTGGVVNEKKAIFDVMVKASLHCWPPTASRDGGPANPPAHTYIYFEFFSSFQAYSLVDREVGYCQGSAFIVGLLLMQVCDDSGVRRGCRWVFNTLQRHGRMGWGNGSLFLDPQEQNGLISTIPLTPDGFKIPHSHFPSPRDGFWHVPSHHLMGRGSASGAASRGSRGNSCPFGSPDA